MFEMRNIQRVLFVLSLLLMIASAGTCYFGVQHEINKIPPDTRAAMEDFDWIGNEWLGRGIIIFIVAVIVVFASFTLWIIRRRRWAQHSAP